MTETLLPTRYSITEEIPIENRQLATKVKDQLALSIPYYTKAGEPPPAKLRLRDCIIPFPDYEPPIDPELSQYRHEDILTGATKLSSILSGSTQHAFFNPELEVSFITVYYRNLPENLIVEKEGVSNYNALRKFYQEHATEFELLDTFYAEWMLLRSLPALDPFIIKVLSAAGVSQDEIDFMHEAKTRYLDLAIERYPFLAHRFFERYPNLHVLRHQIRVPGMTKSVLGMSIRLDPERVQFVTISSGPLKGHTTITM